MTEGKVRISPTALTDACRLSLYYDKVEERKTPKSPKMLAGTALHASHAEDLRRRARGVPIEDPEEIVNLVTGAFHAAASREEWRPDPEDRQRAEAEVLEEHLAVARSNALVAHELLAPQIQVEDEQNVERRLVVDVKGTSFTLVGVLDYAEPRRVATGWVVWDLKLKGQSAPKTSDVSGSIQLGFYAMAMAAHGEHVSVVGYHWFQQLKSGPTPYECTAPAPTDHNPILWRAEKLSRIFETGLFEPIDPNSMVGQWRCSEKFCGHFAYCPYGQARKVSVGIRKVSAS